jgi:hypothetical protein
LVLLSLACSLAEKEPTPTDTPVPLSPTETSTPKPLPPTSTPEPALTEEPTALPTATIVAKGTELQIINNSDRDIWYLYVSPTNSDEWGDDQLGEEVIPAGGSYTLTGLTDGTYDVQAQDADETPIQTVWGLEIVGSVAQVIEEQPVTLELYNSSDTTIYYLRISPVENDTWGEDVLEDDVIASEGTYTVEGLPTGAYDIQAEDADEEIIETLYNVTLDGYYYWNVVGKMGLPSNAVLRFEDDFTDNRNNWGGTTSDDVIYNVPADGEYCIDIIAEDLTAWEWYEPFRTDEFIAEVACNAEVGSGASCGLGFGDDGDNLYWFEVSPSDQTYALFLLLDDEWQDPLASWTESKNIYPDGWNYLSIERVNGTFSVYINGVPQTSLESDYFPTGRIGLGGATYSQGDIRICLDELRVWRLE